MLAAISFWQTCVHTVQAAPTFQWSRHVFSETILGMFSHCWAVTASNRNQMEAGISSLAFFCVFFFSFQLLLLFTGTAVTPRWCTSWERWSRGTWPTTLRGAKWKVTPRLLTCTSCTRTTCSCGGSFTPKTCCRCCRGLTGTRLSTAASLTRARKWVVIAPAVRFNGAHSVVPTRGFCPVFLQLWRENAVCFGFDNNRKTVDLFHVLQDPSAAKNVSCCWRFQAAPSCRDCERVCCEHICIKQLRCLQDRRKLLIAVLQLWGNAFVAKWL